MSTIRIRPRPIDDAYVAVEAKVPQPKQTHVMVRRKAPKTPAKSAAKSKKKGSKKLNKARRPLSDVTAADVSLKDAADFLGAAWKYGKYALALVNDEEKRLYNLHQDAVINTQQVYYLTGIAQGDDYFNRTGISIKCTNIRLEYIIRGNATAVTNTVRVIVFRDFMNLGSAPAASDLLTDLSSDRTPIISPYKNFLGDRFEVMYDRVHCLALAADEAVQHCRIGLAVNDHVLFQGTGSTSASAFQGSVWMLVLSDNATNQPFLTASTLVDFVDS